MHLQRDVLACPERPSDAAEHEAYLLLRQVEAGGDLLAVLVQPLRGDVELDAATTVVGQGERGLETEEGLVLHPDLVRALDHDRPRRPDITSHDALVPKDVAIGMDRVARAGDRNLGVEQRFEHLVLDDDRRQRPPARLGMVGGDGGDRLTDVSHMPAGEHRLVLADQAVGEPPGHVVSGDDGFDPVDPPRRPDVDAHDPCVRVRRAQRRPPEAALGRQVGRERERALDLGDAVGAHRRRTDDAVTHRRTRRVSTVSTVLMSQPPGGRRRHAERPR